MRNSDVNHLNYSLRKLCRQETTMSKVLHKKIIIRGSFVCCEKYNKITHE